MIFVNTPSRSRLATIALSIALVSPLVATAVVPAPASAAPSSVISATPALSSTVLTPGREIGLVGTVNTRTLAGYVGMNGKHVKDLVLRSDSLYNISTPDIVKLRARGLTTIVDLRTSIERQVQPDRRVPGARNIQADVLGQVSPISLVDVASAYPQFVTNANARKQIRATLLQIKTTAARGKTTLFHCSAGKDRTGWVAATLLTILGVNRTTINADFLASNVYRHASPNNPFSGVNMGMLNSAYNAANSTYGSMDNYIRKGLHLSDADIASLRRSLLA